MPNRIAVIVNVSAGADDKKAVADNLIGIFRSGGLDARVTLAPSGAKIIEAARLAAREKQRAIVAGGGDGTINAVASRLVGSDIALGVLPLGTLNHFAKDLSIPLELDAAARNIIAGRAVQVDVGEVNGRIFLNNSSLGLYPSIVLQRKKQQEQLGRGKWPAFAWATLTMLRRYPFLSVRLSTNDRELVRRTPFVFIGNNEYQMESFNIGARGCLDAGQLSLYMPHRTGRLGLLGLALRALFGRLREAKDFDTLCTKEIWIETRRKRLPVALDGEVTIMDTPLHYRVRPGALRVIVPESHESSGAEEGEHAHARPSL
jgi:diacylglycerol kinase family enzyme